MEVVSAAARIRETKNGTTPANAHTEPLATSLLALSATRFLGLSGPGIEGPLLVVVGVAPRQRPE
jgi:hypothetical protein